MKICVLCSNLANGPDHEGSFQDSRAYAKEDLPLGCDLCAILDKIEADMLQVWKQKNGNRNGSSNTMDPSTERIQLPMPLLH